jgi:hypothetical protein
MRGQTGVALLFSPDVWEQHHPATENPDTRQHSLTFAASSERMVPVPSVPALPSALPSPHYAPQFIPGGIAAHP